jgi:hypothetical protein
LAGRSDQAAARQVFMGDVADSIAVKILLGVATAAVWFALSSAPSAQEAPGGPSAAEHACQQQVWTQQHGRFSAEGSASQVV